MTFSPSPRVYQRQLASAAINISMSHCSSGGFSTQEIFPQSCKTKRLHGKVTQFVFHGWHGGYLFPLHLQLRQRFGVLFVWGFFLLLTLLQSYLRDSVCYFT